MCVCIHVFQCTFVSDQQSAAPTHHSRGVRVKDGLGARLRVVSEDVGGVGPAQGSLLHAAVRWRAHTGWSNQPGGSKQSGQTLTASPVKRHSWSTKTEQNIVSSGYDPDMLHHIMHCKDRQ